MRRVLPLTIGSLALGVDAYVIAGMLPAMGRDLHIPTAAAGQAVTVFTLTYGLLSPFVTTLAARWRTRTMLLAALALFTLGNAASALAASLPLLLVSRAVAGLGAGIYAPMAAVAATAAVDSAKRGRALAMLTGAMSIGAAAGVPTGLALADSIGWRATMWGLAALGIAASIVITVFVTETGTSQAPPTLRRRVGALADIRVLSVSLVMMLIAATSIGLYTYIASLLATTVHTGHLADFLWAWGLGGLVGSLLIGRVVDAWLDTRALVSVIVAILGAAFLSFPILGVTAPGAFLLLMIWGAAGWGSLAPQQHRMLTLRGPVAVALNSSALYLGSALGAGGGGLLLDAGVSVTQLAYIAGGTALAVAVANLLFTPGDQRKATACSSACDTLGGRPGGTGERTWLQTRR